MYGNRDLLFFHQVDPQLFRERAEGFRDLQKFGMILAVNPDHLGRQGFDAGHSSRRKRGGCGDVVIRSASGWFCQSLTCGWLVAAGFFSSRARTRRRNVGFGANFTQRPGAAAAIIDAQLFELARGVRHLGGDFAYSLGGGIVIFFLPPVLAG